MTDRNEPPLSGKGNAGRPVLDYFSGPITKPVNVLAILSLAFAALSPAVLAMSVFVPSGASLDVVLLAAVSGVLAILFGLAGWLAACIRAGVTEGEALLSPEC
jgi:hypothetical protein